MLGIGVEYHLDGRDLSWVVDPLVAVASAVVVPQRWVAAVVAAAVVAAEEVHPAAEVVVAVLIAEASFG